MAISPETERLGNAIIGLNNTRAKVDLSNLTKKGENKLSISGVFRDISPIEDLSGYLNVRDMKYSTFDETNFTVIGTPTIVNGIASSFSNTSYITIPSIIKDTDDFSIFVLYQHKDFSNNQCIICDSNAQHNMQLSVNSNKLKFGLYAINFTLENPETFVDGEKYLVGIKKVGNDYTLMVDDNAVLTKTLTSQHKFTINNLTIGTDNVHGAPLQGSVHLTHVVTRVGNAETFNGNLKGTDEVQISDTEQIIIPYTLSLAGSKIVDIQYRDRVIDLYNKKGKAFYYTIDEVNKNFTLPLGELYSFMNGDNGGSGGTGNPDNTTIIINEEEQLRAIGVAEKNKNLVKYDWVGTLAEYNAQNIATAHPDWVCYITDDATVDAESMLTDFDNRITTIEGKIDGGGGALSLDTLPGISNCILSMPENGISILENGDLFIKAGITFLLADGLNPDSTPKSVKYTSDTDLTLPADTLAGYAERGDVEIGCLVDLTKGAIPGGLYPAPLNSSFIYKGSIEPAHDIDIMVWIDRINNTTMVDKADGKWTTLKEFGEADMGVPIYSTCPLIKIKNIGTSDQPVLKYALSKSVRVTRQQELLDVLDYATAIEEKVDNALKPDEITIKINPNGTFSASTADEYRRGIVKPDRSTIKISNDGSLSAATATSSNLGVVKPDGTSITIDSDGTIHSSGGASTNNSNMGLSNCLLSGEIVEDTNNIIVKTGAKFAIAWGLNPDGSAKSIIVTYTGPDLAVTKEELHPSTEDGSMIGGIYTNASEVSDNMEIDTLRWMVGDDTYAWYASYPPPPENNKAMIWFNHRENSHYVKGDGTNWVLASGVKVGNIYGIMTCPLVKCTYRAPGEYNYSIVTPGRPARVQEVAEAFDFCTQLSKKIDKMSGSGGSVQLSQQVDSSTDKAPSNKAVVDYVASTLGNVEARLRGI